MKKFATMMGILLVTGIVAQTALAYGPGWGCGKGQPMRGYWEGGPGYGLPQANLTEEQRSQLDNLATKIYSETVNLRNKIWSKKAELNALLYAPTPDAQKAKALQKEISDLKAELAEKRLENALEAGKIAPGAPLSGIYGPGFGKGPYGPGMDRRGYHGAYCPGPGYGRYMGGPGPGRCAW